MIRTTVFLTRELRERLAGYARERGMREAHVIRLGVEAVVGRPRAHPEGGFLFEPADPGRT
jgi:hypothetical protein